MTYNITKATEKDGAEMTGLLERTEIHAPIELMLARRPNVFLSYKEENKDAEVFLIKRNDEIILQVACLPYELFIDGKAARAGYLCGFRKKAGIIKIDYSVLMQEIFNQCRCDFYYANIVDGNIRAARLLAKGHRQLPAFHPLCKYTSFVFRAKKTEAADEFIFRKTRETDSNRIAEFIKWQRGKYDLFPAFDFKQYANLSIDDFYLLEKDNDIVCICALWRQDSYKQYMVKRYNGVTRLLSFLPAFPKPGEAIKNPVISFFLPISEDPKYYTAMLRCISNAVAPRSGLFTVGAIQNTALYEILSQRAPAARFDSTIYTLNKPLPCKKIHIEGGLL